MCKVVFARLFFVFVFANVDWVEVQCFLSGRVSVLLVTQKIPTARDRRQDIHQDGTDSRTHQDQDEQSKNTMYPLQQGCGGIKNSKYNCKILAVFHTTRTSKNKNGDCHFIVKRICIFGPNSAIQIRYYY